VAHHLAGQTAFAIKTLDEWIGSSTFVMYLPHVKVRHPLFFLLFWLLRYRLAILHTLCEKPKQCELLLYRVQLLEESGDLKGALEYLKEQEKLILDVLVFKESVARLNLLLGEYALSKSAYMELLQRNPENYTFHAGLQQAGLKKVVTMEVLFLFILPLLLPCR